MLKTRVAVLTDREYTELLAMLEDNKHEVLQSIYNKLNAIYVDQINGVSIYPNHSTLSDAA